jgi:hypothetical protein
LGEFFVALADRARGSLGKAEQGISHVLPLRPRQNHMDGANPEATMPMRPGILEQDEQTLHIRECRFP